MNINSNKEKANRLKKLSDDEFNSQLKKQIDGLKKIFNETDQKKVKNDNYEEER